MHFTNGSRFNRRRLDFVSPWWSFQEFFYVSKTSNDSIMGQFGREYWNMQLFRYDTNLGEHSWPSQYKNSQTYFFVVNIFIRRFSFKMRVFNMLKRVLFIISCKKCSLKWLCIFTNYCNCPWNIWLLFE